MTVKDVLPEAKAFIGNDKKSVELFDKGKEEESSLQIKVYRKRWFILLIYILFTLGNKSQYVQYTMILNIITKYYNVSTLAVKGTAMVFNMSVPLAIYPCTLIMNRWGYRRTMILCSASTCIGTWIKYISTSPDRYALMMLGQTLVGAWQVFVISMPGGLAARWFGTREVATATALGYFGIKIGMAAISFLMPIVVRMHENIEDIGEDLKSMMLPQAVYCSCVALLVIAFFEEEPKLPPTKSRALQKINKVEHNDFWSSLRRIMTNRNYFLFWMAQNLIIGHLIAILSTLNSFYMIHFKNGEKDVGLIGSILVMSGLVGAVLLSRILDKTKKFKAMSVIITVATVLSFVMLAVSFCSEVRWAVFVAATIWGFFSFGYHPISCEVSIEISYPVSESFSISVLMLGNQIFTVVITTIADKLLLYYSDVVVYVFLFVILIIGLVLTMLTEDVRKRQNAGNVTSPKTNQKC